MRRGVLGAAAVVLGMTWGATASGGEPLTPEQRVEQARKRVAAAKAAIEKQQQVVAGWAADADVVAAVKAQNAAGPIAGMDNGKWAKLAPNDPLVARLMGNPAGKFLRAQLASNPRLYVEAFLCAAHGEKAALAAKTTSYLHKGMAKFDVPFQTGKLWQGKAEFDASSRSYSVQVSAPVMDGGKPIGVLVVGMALQELEKGAP